MNPTGLSSNRSNLCFSFSLFLLMLRNAYIHELIVADGKSRHVCLCRDSCSHWAPVVHREHVEKTTPSEHLHASFSFLRSMTCLHLFSAMSVLNDVHSPSAILHHLALPCNYGACAEALLNKLACDVFFLLRAELAEQGYRAEHPRPSNNSQLLHLFITNSIEEVVTAQGQERDSGLRADGGSAWTCVNHRKLTKESLTSDGVQHTPIHDDLAGATLDDVELVARLSLLHDDFASFVRPGSKFANQPVLVSFSQDVC
mmetsp:Transcript_42196/g.78966  ORF Transcript_42196/g.78966 Transcript_42196/m.78966 type:complete len:257 (+) Transcript_42196:730-1500(+)